MNLLFLALNLGFVVLPLVFWPWAKVSFEVPKVWFFNRWVELLAILVFFYSVKLKAKKVNKPLLISLTIWLVAICVVSILGSDFIKSVVGNYYRNDGLLTVFHLVGFSLVIFLVWKDTLKERISFSIVTGSTLVSIWSIIEKLLGKSVWGGAVGAGFGQPNFLAGYLLVTLPFTFYLKRQLEKKNKYLFWICVCIQLVSIVLTQSLASILGVLILLFILKSLHDRKINWIFVIVVLSIVSIFTYKWFTSIQSQQFIVFEGRPRIFTKIVLGILQKPITGYGWANVDKAFEKVKYPSNITIYHDVYVDKAHSNILESFATGGIVGLSSYLLFLLVLGLTLFRRYKLKKDTWSLLLLAVFLIYLYHSQTNITSIAEEVIIWLLVGMALES